MTRTLVVQTAWLGDVLLTTPLLEALAARHGAVDVLVTPNAAPLVETHPAVSTVLTYDKHGRERGPIAFWRLADALRARRYDLAVLPQGSLRSGLLTWAAGIPRRIGFADEPAARWYTERRARPEGHQVERLLALAGSPDAAATGLPSQAARETDLGVRPLPGSTALSLTLTAADRAAADAALADAGVRAPFVVLAPGSARPTKRWPHYGQLAHALAPEIPVVVIGAASDADDLVPPIRRSAAPPADLTGLPIRVSAAVLARATVAVVNDSAPLHLAQAVGTPVVALFGPTQPRGGFGPRGPRDVTLGIELTCRPCSTHGGRRCPLRHHRCLRELTAASVREAVRRALTVQEVPCVS